MTTQLDFVTLDVFTTTPFKGNPLGIVHVPPRSSLSQAQKQVIAREFNLSETVFIHDVDPGAALVPSNRHIDIFMTDKELPFAGHPTVGTAHYLEAYGVNELITKAGRISIRSNSEDGTVSAAIPHNTHLNSKVLNDIRSSLRDGCLHSTLEIRSAELGAPLFSIVKGVTFALIRLPSVKYLCEVSPGSFPCSPQEVIDTEWNETFLGRYYYVITEIATSHSGARTVRVRTRMMDDKMEDPATGSAACALASHLALTEYKERDIQFEVTQGVEMGRQSDIVVQVQVSIGKHGERRVSEVHLGGKAIQIMKGSVVVPNL